MKKLLSILLLFLSVKGFCQFPVNSTNGTATTTNLTRGIAAADSAFQYRTYFADTTAANRGRIDEVPGVVIRTAPNYIWLRNSTATAWIRQANINDIINVTGCYTLLNGGIVTWSGSGLTMDVTAANYIIGCSFYSSPTSQVTLAASDPTYERFDVIYVNTSGAVGVLTGTASATPVIPQVNTSTQLQLTVIDIPAGATTPGGITQTIVYDENLGTPDEWTSSFELTSGSGTVDFNSTSNPYHLTKNAVSDVNIEGDMVWTNGSVINASSYSSLKFYVYQEAPSNPSGSDVLEVILSIGGSEVTGTVSAASYGFDRTLSGSYQLVTIPMTAFSFYPILPYSSGDFDEVRIRFFQDNTVSPLHIDYVQLQGGIPTGNSPYITNIFRVPGVDSIYFTKNGINYSIKDSIGSGGGGSYTFGSGLTESPAGTVKWGGTLSENTDVNTAGNILSLGVDGTAGAYFDPTIGVTILGDVNGTGSLTNISIDDDNSKITIGATSLRVSTLPSTTDTTGKSLVIRNLTTGLLENVAPALIGGGGNTIYTGDGTIPDNRTVDLADGKYLFFNAREASGGISIDHLTDTTESQIYTDDFSTGIYRQYNGTAVSGQAGVFMQRLPNSENLPYLQLIGHGGVYIDSISTPLSNNSTDSMLVIQNSVSGKRKIGYRAIPSGGSSNWTLTGSNDIYNNNSANVGIGTTTPGSLLEVYGSMSSKDATYTTGFFNIDPLNGDAFMGDMNGSGNGTAIGLSDGPGKIYLKDGTLATASNGYVWTLADNSTGEGGWAASSGWALGGNAISSGIGDWLGTLNNRSLRIRTNNSQKLYLDSAYASLRLFADASNHNADIYFTTDSTAAVGWRLAYNNLNGNMTMIPVGSSNAAQTWFSGG